jgi:uncharacterized membrane protein YphA (DoxX/SURF4 family)
MTAPAPLAQTVEDSQRDCWSPVSRVAFRFCFVYLGLFCLLTQILPSFFSLSLDSFPDPGTLWPFRPIVSWMALHFIQRAAPLSYGGNSASMDDTFGWATHLCMLVFAALVTVGWSIFNRRRGYASLHKWFRVLVRFSLASQMFSYGFVKVFPSQMPFQIYRLVEPFGNFSPMGVLWSFMGASQPYEIFGGCAEVLGGILLILPRTATLGALICMADMTQVFILNMTYDVGIKVFSFHLLLLSLFLFTPEARRMAAFLSGDDPVGPSTQPELFSESRARRIALAAQIVFGVWLLGLSAHIGWNQFVRQGTPSPLYGIWKVDEFLVDGQTLPPLVTDTGRWRRVIVDAPGMNIQRMDDSLDRYGAAVSMKDKTIVLSKPDDPKWHARLQFDNPGATRMTVDGEMDHHSIHAQLQLADPSRFLLVNRGFHWIQERPLFR